jgi:transaldolase
MRPDHPIARLAELGQSVWLDFIDRDLLTSGELGRLIAEDGLAGATSNPTIFKKALDGSAAYDDFVKKAPPDRAAESVFEGLAARDVADACDSFRAVYDRTDGRDGFVSIEVAPAVARDTAGSARDARRLWSLVGRPNVMVKIPGTRVGVAAIHDSLAGGININITLLFSVARYREVADAYVRALERRLDAGEPIDRIASVASFFVSRVDTKVDKQLDALARSGDPLTERAKAARGSAAIANASLAFAEFTRIFSGERWERLASRGARPQRVLWASTSTKDPAYPDLYYAEALVAPDTIDTMTRETLRALLDHGRPRSPAAILDATGGKRRLDELRALGVDYDRVTRELEDEGIGSFAKSFDEAVAIVRRKRGGAVAAEMQSN